MNMSEFDGQMNRDDACSSPISISGHRVPDDFSEEDVSFAQELGSLFDVEQENLPPYFVQTLLDSENPRFQPVEQGFEHKTRARVFRRLKLKRHLFRKTRFSFATTVAALPARRPLMAFSMAMMLFMLMTIVITGPSFAAGMEILLGGGKAGILAMHEYPRNAPVNKNIGLGDFESAFDPNAGQKQIPLAAAQHQLHFPMYWPQAIPDNYTLNNIYLYQEPQQQWTDGPFIEFDYNLPDNLTFGTGTVAVREFKLNPSISVLQVVKDGAAQPIDIAQNGQATAIYVDGQWTIHDKLYPAWVYGQRCQLIYQRDGIVFWIVGDQRDGMNQGTLMNIANSLQPLNISRVIHTGMQSPLNYVTVQDAEANGPFSGDLLAIFPGDSTVGPYLSVVGATSNQPANDKPVQPSIPPLHLLRPAQPLPQ